MINNMESKNGKQTIQGGTLTKTKKDGIMHLNLMDKFEKTYP